MPPRHQFGQQLNQNARREPNMTPAQQLIIIAKAQAGATVHKLVEELGGQPTASAPPSDWQKLTTQRKKYLALGGPLYYHVTRKRSFTGRHVLLPR
jgi:hypothetical protein